MYHAVSFCIFGPERIFFHPNCFFLFMRGSFFYVELSIHLQSEANVVMNDIFDIFDSVSSILLRNFVSIFSREINMKF